MRTLQGVFEGAGAIVRSRSSRAAPGGFHRLDRPARVAEWAYAIDLKSMASKEACGFESHPGHPAKSQVIPDACLGRYPTA